MSLPVGGVYRFLALLGMSGCFVGEAELERALDRDGDGVLPLQAGGEDCDESRADVRPGAVELCGDGVDNDCDGIIDDDGVGAFVWYQDDDGDGYGTEGTKTACVEPPGYAPLPGDCNDANQAYNPGVLDLCDGLDQDCDEVVDDDAVQLRRYRDVDGDGWGDDAVTEDGCAGQAGWVDRGGDCDDASAAVNPSVVVDPCDGVDQDCDGAMDEDAVFELIWPDADLDGWGSEDPPVLSCDPPVASAIRTGDCDDLDDAVNPGLDDVCDGVDADCDGVPDDDASFTIWFADADEDGLGDALAFVETCDGPPEGYVPFAGDCDDTDASATIPVWYPDDDGDGFGRSEPVPRCEVPSGHTDRPGDCDDQASDVNPDQEEVCNNRRDDDCEPSTDCRWSGELTEADAQVYELPPGSTEANFVGRFLGEPYADLMVRIGTGTAIIPGPDWGSSSPLATSGAVVLGIGPDGGADLGRMVATRGNNRVNAYLPPSLDRIQIVRSASSAGFVVHPLHGPLLVSGEPTGNGTLNVHALVDGPVFMAGDFVSNSNGQDLEGLGARVSGCRDSDGIGMVASSSPASGTGRVYGWSDILDGFTPLASAAFEVDGPVGNTALDFVVADLNGDANDDLVILGTDRGNGLGEGFAAINLGPLDIVTPTIEGAWRIYGQPGRMDRIEPIGDVDGDGIVDFAAVLDGAGQGNPLIPIWFGGPEEQGIAESAAYFLNTDTNAAVASFAGIADTDGDGYDDLGLILIDTATQAARLVVIPGRGL